MRKRKSSSDVRVTHNSQGALLYKRQAGTLPREGARARERHERHERYVNKTLHLAWHALSALLAPAAAATPFLHLTSGAMPVLPSLQKNIGL